MLRDVDHRSEVCEVIGMSIVPQACLLLIAITDPLSALYCHVPIYLQSQLIEHNCKNIRRWMGFGDVDKHFQSGEITEIMWYIWYRGHIL